MMALPCASSSSSLFSTSSSKPKFSKTPFLGFFLSILPPTASLGPNSLSRAALQIRAQDLPKEQRWMFEDDEVHGPDIWNKTWYPTASDHVPTEKKWYVVDATDKILGRMASTIANYIRGKNLATYTPSVDMGAFVIVVNAEKVAVSGKKRTQKLYRRHSGRPGGMKVETFDQLQQRIPERIIEHAVCGMLPKGSLVGLSSIISRYTRVQIIRIKPNSPLISPLETRGSRYKSRLLRVH